MADAEVETFLQQCDLQQYAESFREQNILSRDHLMILTPLTLDSLIPVADHQQAFINHWKATFGIDFTVPLPVVNEVAEAPYNKFEVQTMLSSLISRDKILLWIRSDPKGVAIFSGYEKTNILQNKQANLIVEVIVNETLKVSTLWENAHFKKIAEILAGKDAIFPDQSVDTYYISPVKAHMRNNIKVKSKPSAGKIPTKFRNLKQKLRELENSNTSRNKDEENSDPDVCDLIPSQNVQESVNWLQSKEKPKEDLFKHWKATVGHRFNRFRANKDQSVESVFQEWSVLQNPDLAADLIKIDFDANFSAKKDAITNFENFFKIIKTQQAERKDVYIKNLEEISESDVLSADHIILAQLSLMAFYYPPQCSVHTKESNTKSPPKKKLKSVTKTDSKSSKSVRKLSSTAAVDTMIQFVEVPAEIENVRDAVVKAHEKNSIQPYIIGTGPSLCYSQQYFVVINSTLLLAASAADAIDICLKIFHVFDLEYPKASEQIWILIEEGLYHLKSNKCRPISQIANVRKILKEKQTDEATTPN